MKRLILIPLLLSVAALWATPGNVAWADDAPASAQSQSGNAALSADIGDPPPELEEPVAPNQPQED